MCGIVGYCGYQNAGNIVIDGLKLLEYRGYDSAGIAFNNGAVYKTAGSVEQLESLLPDISMRTAIGHTRWATHGKPIAKNAHPHLSFDGNFAVVHNGVIENCAQLKSDLRARGIRFISDTDSEIIAHLIACEYSGDVLSTVEKVGKMLQGAATFLVLHKGEDAIYMRRKGASLAVGTGMGENLVASDTLALSKYTRKAIVLKDGESAVLTADSVKFFCDGKQIIKQAIPIRRTPPKACRCHMRAEIAEIPCALKRTYTSFCENIDPTTLDALRSAKRVFLVGCGTAYHACIYGKYLLEAALNVPCEAIVASEFDTTRVNADYSCILITQSGETADTLFALERCKKCGAPTLAITNVSGSSITFSADNVLLLDSGAEVAVAATKSYVCQLYMLYLLASALNGAIPNSAETDKLADDVASLLGESLFEERFTSDKLFFVGKGTDCVTAQEGALKFKEITYRMTDAYAAGELKHGAIALIDSSSIVVVIATDVRDKERVTATVSELASRGAYVAAISSVGNVGAHKTLYLPQIADTNLYPILAVIPLQNLALNTSLALGLNPDRPRNLAKSVTVI